MGSFGLNSAIEFDAVGSPAAVSSTFARTGTYSGKVLNPITAASPQSFRKDFLVTAVNTGKFYARVCIYIHAGPGATTAIFGLSNSTSNTAAFCRLVALTSARKLQIRDSTNAQVGSDSASALNTDQWYTIDLMVDFTTPKCEVRVDGTVVLTDNTMANTTTVSRMHFGCNLGQTAIIGTTSLELYFDDYALNKDSGTNETGYVDPTEGFYYLWPDGDAATSSMTTYTIEGSSPAASTWQSVNESPTPDDGVTYLRRPLVSGSADRGNDFTMQDPTTVYGFRTTDTITCIQVHVRGGANSTADTTTRNVLPRIKSHDGGATPTANVLEGASVHLNTNITTPVWNLDGTSNSTNFPLPGLTSYGIVASTGVPLGDSTIDGTTNIRWPTSGANSLVNFQIGFHSESTTGSLSNYSAVSTIYAVVGRIPGPIQVSISDLLALSDTATPTVAYSKSITNSFGLTDSKTAETGGSTVNRTINDSFGLTDVVPRSYAQTFSDSFGFDDSGLAVTSSPDHFILTDFLGRDITRTLTDSLGLQDNVGLIVQQPGQVTFGDRLGLTDANRTAALAINRTINDTLGMVDTVHAATALTVLADVVFEIGHHVEGWRIG